MSTTISSLRPVTALAPGRSELAIGGPDGTLQVRGSQMEFVKDAHQGAICSLCWSPQGSYVASGGSDKQVHIWDIAKQKLACSFTLSEPASLLTWSPSGERLAAVCNSVVIPLDVHMTLEHAKDH